MSLDGQVQYNKMDYIHQTILAVLREERELQDKINEQRAQMQSFTEKLSLLLNLWNENKLFVRKLETNTSITNNSQPGSTAAPLYPAIFYTLHELLISYSTLSSATTINQITKNEHSDEEPLSQEHENRIFVDYKEQCDVSVINELIVQRLTDTQSLPPHHMYLFGSLQPSSFDAFCTILFAQVAEYSHRLPLLNVKNVKDNKLDESEDKRKSTESTEEQKLLEIHNKNNNNNNEFEIIEVDKTHRLLEFLQLALHTNQINETELLENNSSNNITLSKAESCNENNLIQKEEEQQELSCHAYKKENLQLEFVSMLRETKWRQRLRFVCIDLAEIRDVLTEKAEYLQQTGMFTVNHKWLDKLITTAELAHVLLQKLNALFSDL